MNVQVFHVVGSQGAGKSSLIRILAQGLESEGKRCYGADFGEPAPHVDISREEAIAQNPDTDVIFLERSCDGEVDAEPGDWVIHCGRKS